MTRSSIPLYLILVILSALLLDCRKKDNPVETPAIDSNLLGVWYNGADTVGFELLSDGTMRNLEVDSTGKLQYSLPPDTIKGALILNVESARSGVISIKGSWKSHTVDSTYISTGTYVLSNNGNRLTLTLLLPINGASQTTFVYDHSSIGAVVVHRGSFSALGESEMDGGVITTAGLGGRGCSLSG